MAKYAGLVGYATQTETSPGVWSTEETRRRMKGDIIRQSSTHQADGRVSSSKMHSDISLSHRVSLLGDAYAFGNYFNIAWIEIDGAKWEVQSVEVQRPRLILSLGGMWNAN